MGWRYERETLGRKRVFLIGAGFSKPFGFPLSVELLPQLLIFLKSDFDFSSSQIDPRELEKNLSEAISKMFRGEKKPTFEELLSEFDSYLHMRKAWNQNPDEFISETRGQILRTLTLYLDYLHTKVDSVEKISDLIKRYAERNCAFVSLNYDVLLEKGIHSSGFDLSFLGRKDEGIKVIKPHGSMDLWNITGMGSIEYPNKEFEVDSTRYYHSHFASGDTITSDIGPALAPENCPVIIPPTYNKIYQDPLILRQIRLMKDFLSDADDIILLGCSLNPYDQSLLSVIRVAMYSRYPEPIIENPPIWHVVDPNAPEIAKRIFCELGLKPIEYKVACWIDWDLCLR